MENKTTRTLAYIGLIVIFILSIVYRASFEAQLGAGTPNYIDNNAANNLEWVTQSENMLHSLKSGLNPTAIRIIQYDIDGKELKIWDSIKQIEKHLNISQHTISSYCGKKQLVNNEFIFTFENSPLDLNNLPEYLKAIT